MTRPVVFAAALCALPVPALAADDDEHVWTAASVSVDLDERFVATLEGQVRWTDGASRLGQAVIRPSVGIKVNPTTTLSIGYAYVHTDPVGPAESDEHRIWQQATYRLAGDGQGVTVTGRSRLEQRTIEGAEDMGWRFRQQIRLTAPLAGKVRGVVWTEAFLALDDTSWGQRSGLDRWRNSVGLSVPLSGSLTVEPGYINQYVVTPGRDRMHHIANLTMNFRL